MEMNLNPTQKNNRLNNLNKSDLGLNNLHNYSLGEILEKIIDNIPVSSITVDSETGYRKSTPTNVLDNLKKYGINKLGTYSGLDINTDTNITLSQLLKNKQSVLDWSTNIQELNSSNSSSYLSLGMFRVWAKTVLLLIEVSISETTTILFRVCDELGNITLYNNPIDFSINDKTTNIYFKLYSYLTNNISVAEYDLYKDTIQDYLTVKINDNTIIPSIEYINKGLYKLTFKLLDQRLKLSDNDGNQYYPEENKIDLIFQTTIDESTKLTNSLIINIPKWSIFKVNKIGEKFELVDELFNTVSETCLSNEGIYTSYFTIMSVMEPCSYLPVCSWSPNTELSSYNEKIINSIEISPINLSDSNRNIKSDSVIPEVYLSDYFNVVYKIEISYSNPFTSQLDLKVRIKNTNCEEDNDIIINLLIPLGNNNSIFIEDAILYDDSYTLIEGNIIIGEVQEDGDVYKLTITIGGGLNGNLDLKLRYYHLFTSDNDNSYSIKINQIDTTNTDNILSEFKEIKDDLGFYNLSQNTNYIKINSSPALVEKKFNIIPIENELNLTKLELTILLQKEPIGIVLENKSTDNCDNPVLINQNQVNDHTINIYSITPKKFILGNKLIYDGTVIITSLTSDNTNYKFITEDDLNKTTSYYYCEEKPVIIIISLDTESLDDKIIKTYKFLVELKIDPTKFSEIDLNNKPYYLVYFIPNDWNIIDFINIESNILEIRLNLLDFIVFRENTNTKFKDLKFHTLNNTKFEIITLNSQAYYCKDLNSTANINDISSGPSSMPFHDITDGSSYDCGDGLRCGGLGGTYWEGGKNDRYLHLKFTVYAFVNPNNLYKYKNLNITYRVDDNLYVYVNNKLIISYLYTIGKPYKTSTGKTKYLKEKCLLYQKLSDLGDTIFKNGENNIVLTAHNAGGKCLCQFGMLYNTIITADNYTSWDYNNYLTKI